MYPQTTIDALLQSFMQRMAGAHVEYQGYAGEALSLARRWVDVVQNGQLDGPEQSPPSPDGYASTYWTAPPGSITVLFTKQSYDPATTYPAGSLIVSTAEHHIGILVNNNPGLTTATVFEQNADPAGSAAHTAQRPKAQIDGILTIQVTAPAKEMPSYSIVPFSGTFVVDGFTWDLTGIDPQATSPAPDKPIKATAQLIRSDQPGMTYYLEDPNTHMGYRSVDCKPYVQPPSAPVSYKQAEKYEVVTPLETFASSLNAQMHTGSTGTLQPGTYYIHGKDANSLNLSTSNVKDQQTWIYTKDNHKQALPELPPAPQPIPVVSPKPQPSYPAWLINAQPVDDYWTANRDLNIIDLKTMRPTGKHIAKGDILHSHSSIPKDGVQWCRLNKDMTDYDPQKIYAVPVLNPAGYDNLTEARPNTRAEIQDMAKRLITSLASASKTFLDGIKPPKK